MWIVLSSSFSRQWSDGFYVLSKLKTKYSIQIVLLMGDISKNINKEGIMMLWKVAYCALEWGHPTTKKSGFKNFQIIVPYLHAMIKANELSVIGFTRWVGFDIMGINYSLVLSTMYWVLCNLWSHSMHAAHLRSEYRGTLYIALVLSGNEDIHPIGFMIANENEDSDRWM